MKKFIKTMLVLLVITSSFFCFKFISTNKSKVSFADSQILENNIDGIADENLYHALIWDNYNINKSPSERLSFVTVDMFSEYEELNLSSFGISTLLGLEKLNLSNLKRLYLADNELMVLNREVIEKIKNVELLDLSFNKFTGIDLSYFQNANIIDVSYNKLETVNLNNVKDNANINLMGNALTSTNNITIEENKTLNINLIANKLSDFINNLDNCNVDYYYQNTLTEELTTKTIIKIYSGYSIPNFNIKFEKNNEVVKTIYPSEETTLNIGVYTVKFYDGDILLYSDEQLNTKAYKTTEVKVVPNRVSVKFYIDDSEVEYGVFSKPVTLKFFAEDGAKIYVSVNGKGFVEKNEVTISEEKLNSVMAKCSIDDVESYNLNIDVEIKKESFIPTPLLFILCGIALFALLLFFKFYANRPVNFNGNKETKDENN